VFEEKIKKHMELYLHANSNVISMNSLNTIIANSIEKSKLGEASFYEHDIFSPPSTEEKIYFDDTTPPIYDDYNDEYDIFSPPTIEEEISYDYNMPPIFDDYGDENSNDSYVVEFAPTMIKKNDYAYVESINYWENIYIGAAPTALLCGASRFANNASRVFPLTARHWQLIFSVDPILPRGPLTATQSHCISHPVRRSNAMPED
jgi:hypothetical protein